MAGRDGGWQVKNWLAEVVADKGTFIFWRPLTSPPPPLPLSLNPPFTRSITPLCRKSGGAQGGIYQQNTEERNKEKEFKREKEKEILNTFFSNIHQ